MFFNFLILFLILVYNNLKILKKYNLKQKNQNFNKKIIKTHSQIHLQLPSPDANI